MKLLLLLILSLYCLSCGKASKKSDKAKVVATIDYSYQGCFGGGEYSLKVLDQNGGRIALLSENKKFVSSVKFDNSRSRAYEQFLKELKDKKFDFGCTTTDYYKVTIGSERFEKIDGGCEWNGFENLRRSLFKE